MANAPENRFLDEMTRLIEATLKVPAEQIDVDADMEAFGVNSLIVMELMENVEKVFDVRLSPALFAEVRTVRDLSALIAELAAPADAADTSDTAPVATAVPPEPARGEAGVTPQVLAFAQQRYGVDLAGRQFASLEALATELVIRHGDALMRHYGQERRMSEVRPAVAIVGMSCRLPDAGHPMAFWNNLLARRNSVREVPASRWNWEDYYAEEPAPGKTVSKWGALIEQVDCFDAAFFGIPDDEAAAMDPQLRLLLEEAYHAVEDAGIDMARLAGSRTGVFVGYEYSEYEHHLRRANNQDFTQGPLFSSSSPSYYLANRLSHTFDLCGPSEAYNVNCASSAVAISRAHASLLNGQSDLALAGGVSLNLFAGDYVAASQYGILSSDGSSGVFDEQAQGFTRGEGVAMVVLKRLADAQRDGDRIYGLIRAVHENHRGAARSMSEVKHEAIGAALRDCYALAGVDPASVDYVEVDGYASKWADALEYEGIKLAFAGTADGAKHVALGSVKGNIGNTEPVSGVANVIKLALALHHQRFPATISVRTLNGFLDVQERSHPLYIADDEIAFDDIRGEPGRPIRAGVNSFADSGTNVHILLEEYRAAAVRAVDTVEGPQLFVLSARNAAQLMVYVDQYVAYLADDALAVAYTDLIHTAQTGREAMAFRLAVVAGSFGELLAKLRQVRKAGVLHGQGLESSGIYHGRVDALARNPLAGLISAEMVGMQLEQSRVSGQWAQVAQLWVNGVEVPWRSIWAEGVGRRAGLPTYPFARTRHWLDEDAAAVPVFAAPSEGRASGRGEEVAEVSSAVPEQWYFHCPTAVAEGAVDESGLTGEEKMTLFLRQEVALQQQRSIDDVPLDRDFVALGMTSMGIAGMIMRLAPLLQATLPPGVIFKYPDVRSLAGYLARQYAERVAAILVTAEAPEAGGGSGVSIDEPPAVGRSEVLVALQPKGNMRPLFAVPGAGGSALSLQQLSYALGDRQPFFCFDPVGLDGAAPLESVEAMAACNVEAMLSAQPAGPYRLLGYSNGGVVAFEMARQLVAAGAVVERLVLIDTLAPSLLGRTPMEAMTVSVFNRFVGSLGAVSALDAGRLAAVAAADRAGFLYEYACGVGVEAPRRQFVSTFDVAVASERACRGYLPGVVGVEVVLFRAARGFEGIPADYGWGEFAGGGLQVYEVDADHFDIVEAGPIGVVAERLKSLLGASSRRGRVVAVA